MLPDTHGAKLSSASTTTTRVTIMSPINNHILCSSILLYLTQADVIIESKFPFPQAAAYCQLQCSSSLTSIRNLSDELAALSLLSFPDAYTTNTESNTGWIGLTVTPANELPPTIDGIPVPDYFLYYLWQDGSAWEV